MTDIVIVSDLHLEFGSLKIENPQKADVLILSGDIMVADDISLTNTIEDSHRYICTKRYREFFEQVSSEFKDVVYVAGNHEFYNGKWEKSLSDIRNFLIDIPNVHFLEREHIIIDGIVYMGGTTWTDMNRVDPLTLHATQDMMNDFNLIRNDGAGYRKLRPADTVIRHKMTLKYFGEIAKFRNGEKCVMVCHHAPNHRSIHPEFIREFLMNGAYASDLSEFILDHPQIKLVTHGHMHNSSDYYIGETRVICNPRGYVGHGENDEFFPFLTIEI